MKYAVAKQVSELMEELSRKIAGSVRAGADLLDIDRVPLAQEREFFADGLSGGPIVAECLHRRLGCPPNRRAVCFTLEMAID